MALVVMLMLLARSTLASPNHQQEQKPPEPTVVRPVSPKTTEQDLRKLPPSPTWKPGDPVREVPDLRRTEPLKASRAGEPVTPQIVTVDLRQLASVKPRRPGTTARSVRAAEGRYTIHAADGGFAVHDSKGLLVGPLAFSSLWRDAEPCRITVDVAPTVRYDRAAGRWLLARWAPPVSAAAFYLCVALSATSNPVTGGWYVYGFPLPMYRADSEVDVKPDGYRLGISIGGAQILFLLDRTRMLGGAPAGYAQISPSERRPTP